MTAEHAADCLSIVNENQVRENGCVQSQDPTECWADEAAAWDLQLAIEFTDAMTFIKFSIGQNFANDLQASQISWSNTRERDCKVYWPLLFAHDSGAAYCHAEYTAKRIDFLRDVVNRSEFQG
ncbi:lysozyme inhibitor LprI family protein [Octadecabacter temperatus]|uniref:lysozyme inhibitor LprI family protein n=1 Tax=Octadecabacter temperatus TaxID=1458307 RepID=UPI00135635D0|nr:lysozyme inhibitor LprI family protein [Octadecabacter temperatus]